MLPLQQYNVLIMNVLILIYFNFFIYTSMFIITLLHYFIISFININYKD